MAIDSQPGSAPDRLSAIENELPMYRAITPAAIGSLLCGLLSIFNVVSLWALPLSVLGLLLGIQAIRKIQKFPDMLTGSGIAKAGLALSVLTALGASTSTLVQDQVLRADASSFARKYAIDLNQKEFADVAWWLQPPNVRKDKSGQQLLNEFAQNAQDPSMFEQTYGGLKRLKEDVDKKKLEVEYERTERALMDDLVPYAQVLLKVHHHDDPKVAPEFALLILKKVEAEGHQEWVVDRATYPYSPGTAAAPAPVIDDGHGHGPGGH